MTNNKEVFTGVFETKHWTKDGDVSVSGGGSEIRNASVIAAKLKQLIELENVSTVVDCPCGDYNWQHLFKTDELLYIGYDIVPEVIQLVKNRIGHETNPKLDFAVADITTDTLPNADLLIVRDCLVHLSFEDCIKALQNIARQNIRLVAITTFYDRESNADTVAPAWRPLNLRKAPFNLPAPKDLLVEQCKEANGLFPDKALAVYEIEAIRQAVTSL